MTTVERGFLPREGLYIDPIITGLRNSILHLLSTLLCLHLVRGGKFSSIAPYEKLVQITAVASVLLCDEAWDWKKELVVVTGVSGGIGAGVAQRLAAMGTCVVVLDIIPLTYKPEDKRIPYHKCDLSDEKEIAPVCEDIRIGNWQPDRPASLTVAVNNAGLSRGRTVVEGTYGDNSITLKTNLLAPFLLSRESLPAMIRQNHGHIFNAASVSAYIPPPGLLIMRRRKLELRVQNAPKVCTSLAVLGFTKTPLFKGETNQPRFLMPLLHLDTVVDSIVDILDNGLSPTISLPAIFGYFAGLRAAPDWVQDLVRGGTRYLKVDFKGRQKIDPQTGRLVYVTCLMRRIVLM
ncbi:hypothetical protein BDW71DRAFT_200732 [Aspergillus fruticulosus]